MCRDIWLFYLFLYEVALIKGCHGNNVSLSSQSLDQWENTDVTLTCTYCGIYMGVFQWYLNTSSGELFDSYVSSDCKPLKSWLSNDTIYSYRCTNATVQTVTLKNVTQQRHGEIWKCFFYTGTILVPSNTLQILVKVPVKRTTIEPNTNDIFTTKENTSCSFVCKTSECRPEPKFIWYKQLRTQTDGGETTITEIASRNSSFLQSYNHTYSLIFNRTWNGWTLFCGASNSNGSIVLSMKIPMNITYPPIEPPRIGLYQNGSTIKIIKNTAIDLVCSITGGNPLPNLEWNYTLSSTQTLSDKTITNTITWQASDNNRTDLMCLSYHQYKNDATYVTLEVLYPPESIDVSLTLDSETTSIIKHNFSVIESTSNTMLLICSARSNPSPNSYRWTGLIQNNSATLELNMTRYVRGTYTCHANNTMIAYDGRTEQGYYNVPYIVEILQPPDIGRLDDAKVVEGNEVNISCPIISGNDTWRSVKWLNKYSLQVGLNGNLYIKNVTRIANGTYTCQLNFTLQPTYGLQKLKSKKKGFYLDVLYQAEILSLSINNDVNNLTVNETARVRFVCDVDSNPNSTVEITFKDKILSTKSNTQTLEYLMHSVNCNDTGTYVCTASNTYNTGQKAKLDNTLFVLCSPRRSPSFELKQNVTGVLNDSATFQFTAVAYPPPRFQWYRVLNESETKEVDRGAISNYSISTIEMQTNFTLDNVNISHYGEYLLKVENQYGTFNQSFFLIAKGKPNPPTYYGFFPDSVTSDSVTIWWEPGFDGGLHQSFIISYNLTSSKWYNESVISHNKERRMNKTITELASSSIYHVLIYAQNEIGAVRVPHAIIVNTKGKPNPPTYYGFFPDSVTSDSVTIWWEPGFDGGLHQSFIISYNLTSSKWYNESVISHNKERRMNKTITELASSSIYHVLIYAQNEIGAVRVPHAIIVNTKGKPNPPTYYDFFPDSVTSDSVTIWWEPGFDGGLHQSFIISYNLTSSKWYNESVISHNKERRMNKTITELASSSIYHVLIYAQNEIGAVRVPHAIIVNTKGKPNPPTYYDFFPDSVTSDSVTIWWEPGFDGGLHQSFIISYNLTSSKWYNESVISHNKERRMNKTITELASSSIYHVLIYAQNEIGAVRVPHAIIVNTKEVSSYELTNNINIGAAAGGAVGGLLAIVAVVVVAVVIFVRKRSLGKDENATRQKCDFTDSHTYTNVLKDGHSLSEVSSSAVYERLQHEESKSDQQYQQLATFSEKDKTYGQRVYENLKISQHNEAKCVRGESGSRQNTSAHNQSHV